MMARATTLYNEIEEYFEGTVPDYLKALADVDESLLRVKWESYRKTLYDSTKLLPAELKCMMAYQVVKGHSQCGVCSSSHLHRMKDLGVEPETVSALEKNISKTGLDEKSKNILILSYHVSFDPKGIIESNLFSVFSQYFAKREMTEIIDYVTTSAALQDFIHLQHLKHDQLGTG